MILLLTPYKKELLQLKKRDAKRRPEKRVKREVKLEPNITSGEVIDLTCTPRFQSQAVSFLLTPIAETYDAQRDEAMDECSGYHHTRHHRHLVAPFLFPSNLMHIINPSFIHTPSFSHLQCSKNLEVDVLRRRNLICLSTMPTTPEI